MSPVTWEPYEPEPTCDAKRGPRGRVTCEKPAGHTDNEHYGRGRGGRVFFWASRPVEETP